MGRLTLNVLLSFAQFEREVTGERIRDKIAASKKKGMWMGGNLPLGYDRQDNTLVVNPDEAEQVKAIFEALPRSRLGRRCAAGAGSARLSLQEPDDHGVAARSAAPASAGGRCIICLPTWSIAG